MTELKEEIQWIKFEQINNLNREKIKNSKTERRKKKCYSLRVWRKDLRGRKYEDH